MAKNQNLPQSKSVVDISALNEETVPAALAKIDQKISEVTKNISTEPKTLGVNLPSFDKPISKMETVEELVLAYAYVKQYKEKFDEAASEIVPEGTKIPTFKIKDIAATTWLQDIQDRMVIVSNKEKLDKLKKVREQLAQHLTEEQKRQESLRTIAAILNDTEI